MTTTKDLWGQISDLEAMVREWKARTIEVEKRWLAAEARAVKAEAQRDDWKAMHRHAQRTIADLNADLKGQRARAEKAEAALAIMQNWYGLKEQGR